MRVACIAARNEEATIGGIVERLIDREIAVVVVNDGSKDNTAWRASAAGAKVLHNYPSCGIAYSLLRAWQYALDMGAEVVTQLDAGNSHDPNEIDRLTVPIIYGNADMVIGSRFYEGGRYIGRKWRAFASRFAALMLNLATRAHITDWTSGYRAFSRAAVEKLLQQHYCQTMHAWQIEVLGKALDMNIVEVPITYTAGRSSLNLKAIDGAFMEWLWLFNR